MKTVASNAAHLQMAERLRTAADLWTTGVELTRQRLRRAHPAACSSEIEEMVNRWLRDRPGAEIGDGPQRKQG